MIAKRANTAEKNRFYSMKEYSEINEKICRKEGRNQNAFIYICKIYKYMYGS